MKTCDFCKKEITPDPDSCGTGYATQPSGHITCYACCADVDRRYMKRHGKNTLYWDGKMVGNWPGSLKIKPTEIREGRHNIAGSRTDVWFDFNGHVWHGTQYGDFSQILHCKETAKKSPKTFPIAVWKNGIPTRAEITLHPQKGDA